MFFNIYMFWFNIFRIEIIDHIIKFDAFFEMQRYVKFENVKMFFFSFFYSKVCAREKRLSEYLFEIMHFLNNSMSNHRESNIESAK